MAILNEYDLFPIEPEDDVIHKISVPLFAGRHYEGNIYILIDRVLGSISPNCYGTVDIGVRIATGRIIEYCFASLSKNLYNYNDVIFLHKN